MMELDCQNLACPEPVIKTKKALEDLDDGANLQVLVNSEASIQNVTRFAKSLGYGVSEDKKDDKSILTIEKKSVCDMSFEDEGKTLLIKDDKVGEGELGEKLITGFLTAMCEVKNPPKEIFFVNRGVFLTSKNETTIGILKKLEKRGVNIYSCGVCLDFFGIKTQVGEIGNAFQTVETLLSSEKVVSF